MRIDYLYWDECPSHPEALERLRRILAEEDIRADVQVVHVDTDEEARALQFPGSPTIRIDGRDIQPETSAQEGGALTCRLYFMEGGRPSPLPSLDLIRGAVRAARRHPEDAAKGDGK